jgi:intracellular sulfur oxidation DsrE/DsrF family protein
MKKILLTFILLTSFLYSEQVYSDPQPSFDNPRKWVIKLRTDDEVVVNHMLGSIYNVLKEYPAEAINIKVVTYSSGVRVLKKDYKNKAELQRIKSLMEYDVQFVVCRNTMETMKWTDDMFIDGVEYVQAGIVEIIESIQGGYIEVTPY